MIAALTLQIFAVRIGDPDVAHDGLLADRALAGLHLVRHWRQRTARLYQGRAPPVSR